MTPRRSDEGRYLVSPRTLVFLTCGDDVLLLRGAPGKRLWANRVNGIGGHVEPEENVLSAARRELREETGLDVPDLRLGAVVHVAESDAPGVLVFVFVGTSPTRDVTPSAEGELLWVPLDRLDDLGPALVPDLRVLIPRVLDSPGGPPLFARSRFTERGVVIAFAGEESTADR